MIYLTLYIYIPRARGKTMKKEIYLFDFDGTLVDSMNVFAPVMVSILDEYGIPYGKDIVKIITPLGYRGTAEYYQSLGLDKDTDELLEIMYSKAEYAYVNDIQEKEGVCDTLRALKARGAELNVLTASPHLALDPCLKRLGVWELFSNVWSCDDFGTTKADPEIYRIAAKRIGAAVEDVVFVDDNVNAVKTARKAGMRVYGIYDKSSDEFVDEMKKVSEKYLNKLSELL